MVDVVLGNIRRHTELTIYYRFIGKVPENAERAAKFGDSLDLLVS